MRDKIIESLHHFEAHVNAADDARGSAERDNRLRRSLGLFEGSAVSQSSIVFRDMRCPKHTLSQCPSYPAFCGIPQLFPTVDPST